MKEFNAVEVMVPPSSRRSDDQLRQMVGTLFIKDPARRKDWVSHLNQPVITDASGTFLKGPPRNYSEAKELAQTILRSTTITEAIDELDNPSAPVLSAEHVAALRLSTWPLSG